MAFVSPSKDQKYITFLTFPDDLDCLVSDKLYLALSVKDGTGYQTTENKSELLVGVNGEKIPVKKKSHGRIAPVTPVTPAFWFPF